MTINEWLDRVSGYSAKTESGEYVLIQLDHSLFRQLVDKALRNKTGRARDGALSVRVDRAATRGAR